MKSLVELHKRASALHIWDTDYAPKAEFETALHAAGVYVLALGDVQALQDELRTTNDPDRKILLQSAIRKTQAFTPEQIRQLNAEPTHEGRCDLSVRWQFEREEREKEKRAAQRQADIQARLNEERQEREDKELDRQFKRAFLKRTDELTDTKRPSPKLNPGPRRGGQATRKICNARHRAEVVRHYLDQRSSCGGNKTMAANRTITWMNDKDALKQYLVHGCNPVTIIRMAEGRKTHKRHR